LFAWGFSKRVDEPALAIELPSREEVGGDREASSEKEAQEVSAE
jgi:hypothetical protein